jgi:hypothetical protein
MTLALSELSSMSSTDHGDTSSVFKGPRAFNTQMEPEFIEAGECIRSWVGAKLFYKDYFEYLSPKGKLEEHFRL